MRYGRGWNKIVNDLKADLERMAPGITVTGVEESKFGDLSFYYDINSVDSKHAEIVARRVKRATDVALETCSDCGEYGKVRYISEPVIEAHVLCDKHTPKNWKTL